MLRSRECMLRSGELQCAAPATAARDCVGAVHRASALRLATSFGAPRSLSACSAGPVSATSASAMFHLILHCTPQCIVSSFETFQLHVVLKLDEWPLAPDCHRVHKSRCSRAAPGVPVHDVLQRQQRCQSPHAISSRPRGVTKSVGIVSRQTLKCRGTLTC